MHSQLFHENYLIYLIYIYKKFNLKTKLLVHTKKMGNVATLRNCQRATIFFLFLGSLVVTVNTIIRLVKNKIDKSEGSAKYEQGAEKKSEEPKRQQQSGQQMKAEKGVRKSTQVEDDDTPFEKVMKILQDLNVSCLPIYILLVYCLITGTNYAFSIIALFVILIPMIVFNLIKLQRRCSESKIMWAILEALFLVLFALIFLNIWTIGGATDPYFLSQTA